MRELGVREDEREMRAEKEKMISESRESGNSGIKPVFAPLPFWGRGPDQVSFSALTSLPLSPSSCVLVSPRTDGGAEDGGEFGRIHRLHHVIVEPGFENLDLVLNASVGG